MSIFIISDPQPSEFLNSFLKVKDLKADIFLTNHNWSQNIWTQLLQIIQPNDIKHGIMIPSGGTSGNIKFVIHTWETLSESVQGFRSYFQVDQINAFCILPLHHVSGFMQWMRTDLTQGKLILSSLSQIENGDYLNLDISDYFISLVPTQLYRILQNPNLATWLSRFRTVLIGGGPIWNDLLIKAKDYQIRLAPTYGMTETASQIATMKPEDFLAGYQGVGRLLPHATIKIIDYRIYIQAKSLALGYYPHQFFNQEFLTNDQGYLDEQGYLHITGRLDQIIITGGEKVCPWEIEQIIRNTGLVLDICILGIPEPQWGEIVTAIYVPITPKITEKDLKQAVASQLANYQQPKRWLKISQIPRTTAGKLDKTQIYDSIS